MATVKGVLAGRTWEVDSLNGTNSGDTHKGVSSVTRTYRIERTSAEVGASREEKSYEELYSSAGGLPKIGDAHPNGDKSLRVSKITYSEGEGPDNHYLLATVTYSRIGEEQSETGEGAIDCVCEEWGWHSGSVQRDAVHRVVESNVKTAKPILNSAGDPFDSVPQIDFPSPTFTKVFKTKSRIGEQGWNGKVNASNLTIGGITGAARTMKCTQFDETRIINDSFGYKYRYTVSIQYLSNVCKIFSNGQETNQECGWDLVVADTGLRALEYPGGGGDKVLMRCMDEDENGNKVPVSMPVALNGQGERANDDNPVLLRFQVYDEVTFPNVFTSEPAQ